MEHVPLITVERTTYLHSDTHPERSVLVIEPRLRVPCNGWKNRAEPVLVLRPDGHGFEATAQISMSHLNIKMSERDDTMDQRWRVSVWFYGLTGDDIPDGSKILVSRETRDALLSSGVA
jgi:hypothetical protein